VIVPEPSPITVAPRQDLVEVTNVYLNVSQAVIITTEDRAKLCIVNYEKSILDKKGWVTPLVLFVAILTALLTCTFKDFLLNSSTWMAIFIILGAISFIWLINSVYLAYTTETMDLVEELKKGSKEINSKQIKLDSTEKVYRAVFS